MAVKKLKYNEGGLVSEEVVEKPVTKVLPPVPEGPSKVAGRGRLAAERPAEDEDDGSAPDEPRSRRAPAAQRPAPAGRSLLDENVIKFRCGRCGSERVGEDATALMTCGLCGAKMKLIR